jgi:hypothetical protein
MKEIAISEFEAKCPALLDQVEKTKKPIRVTRRREDCCGAPCLRDWKDASTSTRHLRAGLSNAAPSGPERVTSRTISGRPLKHSPKEPE